MTGSKLLKIATWGVGVPLAIEFLLALRTGNVERAILLGYCLTPTAITYLLALWIERVERTARIRFLGVDRGVLLRVRAGIACSLLALAWATVAAFATPLAGAFDLRTAAVILGPMIVSLSLASRAVDSAVEKVVALAEAA